MAYRRRYSSKQFYDFIVEFKKIHDGNFPTYVEIMEGLGASSLSIVHIYIEKLIKGGLLVRDGNHVEVVGGRWTLNE